MSSWFFGSPKSSLPAVTPLQAQRSKQIDSLRNLNPNVVELKRDEEYRVSFNCGSNHVAFTIFLPPEFPQTKPVINVSPSMRHPFLDESMNIVRYLPLINFNVQTDLGRLVQTLIQDFCKSPMFIQPEAAQQRNIPSVPPFQQFTPQGPPPPQQQQPPPLQQQQPPYPVHQPHPGHHPQPPTQQATPLHQPPQPAPPAHPLPPAANHFMSPAVQTSAPGGLSTSSSLASSTLTSTSASMSQPITITNFDVEPNIPVPGMMGIRGMQDIHPYNMPPIPPSFDGLLKDLNQQQLEELLNDEEKLTAVFHRLPQLEKLLQDRASLMQTNEELAKLNLSYQPEVTRLRRELEETVKFRNDLKNKFDMKCLQQQSLNEQCSPHHLLDNTRVAAADAEHTSEELAEKFLDDKVSLDEFLRQFSEQRKLLHIRKVKEEKVSQMLTQNTLRY